MVEPAAQRPHWEFHLEQEVEYSLFAREKAGESRVARSLRRVVDDARREAPDSLRLALALNGLAARLADEGRYDEAISLFTECAATLRRLEAPWGQVADQVDLEIAHVRRRREWAAEKGEIRVPLPPAEPE